MPVHYQIIVKGKVQGVYYRASAKQKAEELNIRGSAQNLPDGSVLIEAEGDEELLQKFIAWCKTGPSGARVASVESKAGVLLGYTRFEIIRYG